MLGELPDTCRIESTGISRGIRHVVVGGNDIAAQHAKLAAVEPREKRIDELVSGLPASAVHRTLQEDGIIAPSLVAFLWHGIVAIDAPHPRGINNGLPAGHHPDLLVGDELETLFPTVPERAELAVSLVLDQEFHDQPELVRGQVAGLGNLRILGALQIDGSKDDAVDPGVFHGGLALQPGIEYGAVA